jgi:hypothetical protein
VQLWRFTPWRSVRRRAHREVLAGRHVFGWRWTWRRLKLLLRRLDWWLPLLTALVVSAPLEDYVGNAAGWLGAAWPVSAVLLGFVIALVVFLLQAVGSRSLRAERTYKAVIAESAIAWPTAFSLVFLGWAAIVERYADTSSAPGWVTTWALGFFIAQLLALLIVFGRIRRLLAPAGVARMLERTMKHDIERGVEERLTRQRAIELLNDALAAVGLSAPLSPEGYEVSLGRDGCVDDIDLKLPRRLASRGIAGEIKVWWLTLGDKVTAAAAIAILSERPSETSERLYRASVRVRRRPRVGEDWIELFQDVIDLGLSALADGTVRDLDTATAVIVAGLTEVPRVYSLFGSAYDDVAVRQISWRPSEEDRMLGLLEQMSADVAGSQKTDALVRLVALPYQLADVALTENVALLLEQAIALWLYQARDARTIASQQTRNAVIDRIHRLSSSFAGSLVRRFEDGQLPVSERERAAEYLRRINWFRGRLLKSYVDADDMGAFRALLSDMTARANARNPIHDADALRAQLNRASDANSHARLGRALAEMERIAQSFSEVLEDRGWDWFKVGAWAAWQHRHDRLRDDTWEYVSQQLGRPFHSSGMAGHLEELVSSRTRVRELDDWDRTLQDVRASVDVWTPRDIEIAMLWAALILLRETNPGSPPTLPTEASMLYSDQLNAQLDHIESDAARWTSFAGNDVQEKAAAIRTAIAAARDAVDEQRLQVTAIAPLSEQRIDRCRELAWEAFTEGNPLRTRLQEVGALDVEEDQDAFSRPRVGGPLPKEAFTDQGRFGVDAHARSLGRGSAARQQGWLYRELVDIGRLVEVRDSVASAISDAIEDLRNNGSAADVVILPNGFIPEGLADDPGFTWTSVNTQELGRLGDASVIGVAPPDAEFVAVCDLSRSVRIRERKRPGDSIPMVFEVKPISGVRAAEMLDAGLAQVASNQTRDEATAELQSLRVEVLADLDYYASGIHVNRAVRLISISTPRRANQSASPR